MLKIATKLMLLLSILALGMGCNGSKKDNSTPAAVKQDTNNPDDPGKTTDGENGDQTDGTNGNTDTTDATDPNDGNTTITPKKPAPIVKAKYGLFNEVGTKSQDRLMIEAAIDQAKKHGKKVLVKIAAGWCGPCLSLDNQLKAAPAEFAKIKTKYEYVVLEQMHWHSQSGLYDFIPRGTVIYFPSLFVYDPVKDSWAYLSASSLKSIQSTLATYEQTGKVAETQKLMVEKLLNDPNFEKEVKFTEENKKSSNNLYALMDTLLTVAYQYDKKESNKFYNKLAAMIRKHPANFDMRNIRYVLTAAGQLRAARGDIDPFKTDIGVDLDLRTRVTYGFKTEIAKFTLTNNKGAFGFCENQRKTFIKDTNAFAASDLAQFKKAYAAAVKRANKITDAAKKKARLADLARQLTSAENEWDYYKYSMDVTCHLLGARTGKINATQADAFLNVIANSSLPGGMIDSLAKQMIWVLAEAGSYKKAISLLEQVRDSDAKGWQSSYDKYNAETDRLKKALATANANLKKNQSDLKAAQAAATPDQAAIDKLKKDGKALADQVSKLNGAIPQYVAYVNRLATLKKRVVKAHNQVIDAWKKGTTTITK